MRGAAVIRREMDGTNFPFCKREMFCAFMQNASREFDSFFQGGSSYHCSSSGGFERQSRVIEFSVDECYIKDL